MPDVNLRFPDVLPTRRLVLRRLLETDAEALCDYRSLPEVAVGGGRCRRVGRTVLSEPEIEGRKL